MKVETALIPAAGRGTRMRPATNAVPKALLTVVDRPSIQWVVEEAARAGVTEVIAVVDPDGGEIVERHFAPGGPGLDGIEVRSVVQEEARGLGHAVLTGREAVGGRPFFVLLADDLLRPGDDILPALAAAADPGVSVVYVREIPDALLGAKGVISPRSEAAGGVMEVGGAVEKPGAALAPSNYGICGRYLFMPEVFDHLERTRPGRGGEIQLTDAIAALGEQGRCRAYTDGAELLDVGNPLGFLHANAVLGALHPVYGGDYRSMVAALMADDPSVREGRGGGGDAPAG